MGAQTEAPDLMGRDTVIMRVVQSVARFDVATDGLRVRLSEAGGRVVAQANARVDRRPVRAQVAAATFDEAADDLADRLCSRIREAAGGWSARPWPDSDDASVPDRRPARGHTDGPGRLARIKAVPLATFLPEDAVTIMDLLDYPVHLFVDAETGLDAVVYRSGPTGYRLARLRPATPPAGDTVPLTVDPRPAPALEPEQAMARLDATGLGHLFFVDPASGRGHLIYRRFDNRYALLKDAR